MRVNRILAGCVIGVVGLAVSRVDATVYNWSGFGTDEYWTTTPNWDQFFTAPGASDDVYFGTTSSAVTSNSIVNTDRTVHTFEIDGPTATQGNFTFSGLNTTLSVSTYWFVDQPNPVQDSATISSGLTVAAYGLIVDKDSHLTISGGGKVVANSYDLGSLGSVPRPTMVIGSGGAFTVTGSDSAVYGGTLELDAGGQFNIAAGNDFKVTGGAATFKVQTDYTISSGATVEVYNGGQIVSSGALNVGMGNASVLAVDGTGSAVTIGSGTAGFSTWGSSGGSGTVQFSRGSTGSYANGVHIATTGGTANTFILSGAQLTITNGLTLGGGTGSVANMSLAGGALQIATGTTGFAQFGSGSTFAFSSGSLTLGGNATFSTGSIFNWSGGTLIASGRTLAINGGVANVSLSGLRISGDTLAISSGGHFDATANVDVGTTGAGTLLVDGTGSRITAGTGPSFWGSTSGNAATVSFSNNAAGTYSAGLFLGVAGATANVSIASGAVVNVGSFLQASDSSFGLTSISLAGGTLNSTGTSEFLRGTTVALSSGGLALGDATFATGSNLNYTGGSISIAGGKTLTFDGGTGTITKSSAISNGATVHITNGAHVTNSLFLDVGDVSNGGANGTFLIDGAGSSYITTAPVAQWTDIGVDPGDSGTVNISNNGAATFTAMHLAGYGGKALINLSSGSLNIGVLQVGSMNTSAATINVSGGTLNLNTTTVAQGGVLNYSSGTISLAGNTTLVGNGKIALTAGGSKVLYTHGLSISGSGVVDLANNGMVVDYTGTSPLAMIAGYIKTGRGAGNWAGTGITSSSAAADSTHVGLGFGEASAVLGGAGGMFEGHAVDGTAVLVKYTYLGDANLDGKVDIADLGALATHYGQSSQTWTGGDFNYDGTVNIADLGTLATDYGMGSGSPLAMSFQQALSLVEAQTGVQLPEPALGTGSLMSCVLIRRRRSAR